MSISKKLSVAVLAISATAAMTACSDTRQVDMANQRAADAAARADQAAKSAQEAAAAAKAAEAAAEAAAGKTGRMHSSSMRK